MLCRAYPGKDPSDASIKAAYEKAVEAFSWFYLVAMPLDSDNVKKHGDFTFNKVVHDTIGTFAELEAYMGTIFTKELVKKTLADASELYRDFDGVLYAVDAARGSNIFAGEETHEIIRVSDSEITYRVSVNMYDGPADDKNSKLEEVKVFNFSYVLMDGNWRFSNFELVK